ncbi:LPS export ABC transporter periplasmic protein LptC [Paenimyroides viscosum]|uniref:LPS export ABC transporter periplasmic protein LptC n=1 Tax=Paenimyroides viscosum TaxID=2488729 RepID=A0A3P1ASR7_9FLAO|nr:LPS export ABC transporter periplasmic protein LptC [Paenimyroides viscosum]RRA92058.1 LPS export ABC transporter periplasmic protein LptC [Paenimyroides viscosum]
MKKYFAHIIILAFVFSACNNDLKDIQNLNKKQLYATGEADSINVKYTDSAKIKAEMYAIKMLDYGKAKYPFNHFPKGIKVTVYDSNRNKNFIVAKQATIYNKTGLINLVGDVKITSHDGKVMKTQQLFYDQKNNWFFTEHYFKVTDKNKSFFDGTGVDFDQNFKIVNAQQNRAELKDVSNESL